MSAQATFLFSIDLEEFESHSSRYFRKTPLSQLAQLLLDFLKEAGMTTTFFVVGKVARAYPEVIAAIFRAGHELACHTDQHNTLNSFTPKEFRKDLERNRASLLATVPAADITGFRAPLLSLTLQTSWAYEVLADLGFKYSSSVLPASSPLFGWPGFGTSIHQIKGIQELPITLGTGIRRSLPFAAGTYLRCLPKKWFLEEFERAKRRPSPIVGYCHPYDIDIWQQYVIHKEMSRRPYLNPFLYWGRRQTIPRLRMLVENGFVFHRYADFLATWRG
ncbi:MAG: hypothetical protein C5B47_02635 [Verrucomicrobia bacterium]|nr:MAG: hypothetical protein C5B47_02635 [Verrucomicrobiota bacterium]